MARPDDIAGSLPQPPPPSPARREAAIGLAMARFDARDGSAPPFPARPAARHAPWWRISGRPQIGALVTAVIVAMIGGPVAWMTLNDSVESDSPPKPEIRAEAPASPGARMPTQGATPDMRPSPVAAPPSAATARFSESKDAAASKPIAQAESSFAPAMLPPPPPPPPPPPAMARADAVPAASPRASPPNARTSAQARDAEDRDVVTGSAIRGRPSPGTSVVAIDREGVAATGANSATELQRAPQAKGGFAAQESRKEADDRSIVVTGTARRTRAIERGDWNACLVSDPTRSLRGCRNLVNSNAKGTSGRAAAHVADGLKRAWSGDLNGAVAAFSQAIDTAPGNALAYLNRGLAYQRKGDLARAAADLDRAVRLDPGAARGYYSRGQLLRQQGNLRRARTDEQRAIQLDPDYADVLE
jgi:hypothetical protein